jgi:Protein of unknown function (DUF4231)
MADSMQINDVADPWDAADPALALALQQVHWYARHRDRSRFIYQVNEMLILIISASTTVAAALQASGWLTAVLAAGTVVLAGLYKVLDAQENWVAFGIAWSELQTAVNDYRLLPPDRRGEDAQRLLVNKVNDVMHADTGRWAARRRTLAQGRT